MFGKEEMEGRLLRESDLRIVGSRNFASWIVAFRWKFNGTRYYGQLWDIVFEKDYII